MITRLYWHFIIAPVGIPSGLVLYDSAVLLRFAA